MKSKIAFKIQESQENNEMSKLQTNKLYSVYVSAIMVSPIKLKLISKLNVSLSHLLNCREEYSRLHAHLRRAKHS